LFFYFHNLISFLFFFSRLYEKKKKTSGDTQAKAKERKIHNPCRVIIFVKKEKKKFLVDARKTKSIYCTCRLFGVGNTIAFFAYSKGKKVTVNGSTVPKAREKKGIKIFH